MKKEIAEEAVKASPPLVVTVGSWLAGLTINEFVGLTTIFYILLQAGYLIWKWTKEYRQKN
jgi:hypothetical protein